MTEELKSEPKPTPAMAQNPWIGIIDKLTDPIEKLIEKIASGRFLMAVMTTYFICEMSARIAMKYPDMAPVIVASIFSAWTGMVGFYFGGADKRIQAKNGEDKS